MHAAGERLEAAEAAEAARVDLRLAQQARELVEVPRARQGLGLVAEPSCELTGTIESRNRVDGHVHMFLENVVLHEPVGGKKIHRTKIGRAEMILADQNEFDLPTEPDPNHAPRSRARQKASKPRGRPAAAPRVEELL